MKLTFVKTLAGHVTELDPDDFGTDKVVGFVTFKNGRQGSMGEINFQFGTCACCGEWDEVSHIDVYKWEDA
jgi:hypothetical protein